MLPIELIDGRIPYDFPYEFILICDIGPDVFLELVS